MLDGAGDNEHWWYLIGSGQYGWHTGLPNQRADWAELERMNNEQVPVEQRVFGDGHYLRPSFIQPFRCTNVLIDGVTVINAPMWTIHPLECHNVTVQGVTVHNLGPNGDGCDPESCTDVLIRGLHLRRPTTTASRSSPAGTRTAGGSACRPAASSSRTARSSVVARRSLSVAR